MWVLISFILTLTSTVIIMGKLGDLIGKAVLYNIGWAIVILGAILSTYDSKKKNQKCFLNLLFGALFDSKAEWFQYEFPEGFMGTQRN
jgi:MFS family permease